MIMDLADYYLGTYKVSMIQKRDVCKSQKVWCSLSLFRSSLIDWTMNWYLRPYRISYRVTGLKPSSPILASHCKASKPLPTSHRLHSQSTLVPNSNTLALPRTGAAIVPSVDASSLNETSTKVRSDAALTQLPTHCANTLQHNIARTVTLTRAPIVVDTNNRHHSHSDVDITPLGSRPFGKSMWLQPIVLSRYNNAFDLIPCNDYSDSVAFAPSISSFLRDHIVTRVSVNPGVGIYAI